MLKGKKILALVVARGGSKGVPRKNLREVAGKSLLAWTLDAAKKSKYLDKIILSSDDEEIIVEAKKWGCEVPFVRPLSLAQDDTPMNLVVLHALDQAPVFDFIVLLQPTSPLRLAEDIDGALEFCLDKGAFSCVSVAESSKNPSWMFFLNDDNSMSSLLGEDMSHIGVVQRQGLKKAYTLNGAIYISDVAFYKEKKTFFSRETKAYVMPISRSLDIDTESDLDFFDYLKRKNHVC